MVCVTAQNLVYFKRCALSAVSEGAGSTGIVASVRQILLRYMPHSQYGVVMDKKNTSSGVSRRRLLQVAGAGVAGGAVLYGLDKLRLLPSFEKPCPCLRQKA